jgi:hypothetical protein
MKSIACTVLACLFFALSLEIPLLSQRTFGIESNIPFAISTVVFAINLIALVTSVIMTQDDSRDWVVRIGLAGIIAGSFMSATALGTGLAVMLGNMSWTGVYMLVKYGAMTIVNMFMIGVIFFQLWCWKKEQRNKLQMSLEDE